MRASLTLSLTALVLHLAVSSVSAEPYNAGIGLPAQPWIAPPRAPDMLNPGYYYWTQMGMLYGPNYVVRPCFPPVQGAVPGPTAPVPNRNNSGRPGGGYGSGGYGSGGYGPGGYGPGGSCGPGGCGPCCWPNTTGCVPGTAAFPSHLFSRSPRDFFMIETDPRASPYNYGPYGSSGRTGIDYP